MTAELTYVAFSNARQVAEGGLKEVLPILKRLHDDDASKLVLVFEVESGRQVDFDLRPPLEEILAAEGVSAPRGPGRPRLGVVSREVSLLPRHWDWLEEQPNGISAALRRLVEQAIKTEPGRERARRMRAALSRVLSAMAGNRPNYEEACRALFAGDTERFAALVERWPRDIRGYAIGRAREAAAAEELDASPRPSRPPEKRA